MGILATRASYPRPVPKPGERSATSTAARVISVPRVGPQAVGVLEELTHSVLLAVQFSQPPQLVEDPPTRAARTRSR